MYDGLPSPSKGTTDLEVRRTSGNFLSANDRSLLYYAANDSLDLRAFMGREGGEGLRHPVAANS